MKIVNFTPGLGNQIFEYVLVQYLRKTFPKEKIYGYYNPKFLKKHNGLEVQKIFKIELPPESIWSNFIAFACRAIARFFPIVKATDGSCSAKATYYDGWWQDKRFFLDTISEIEFYHPNLDETNKNIIEDILSSESVSLHIRRGDYLEPQNAKEYGGICTLGYYNEAITIAKKQFHSPRFFVFSNDIEWCKENLVLDNVVYVSNNTGENSWLDMYLMSFCMINILANSSFSYWGAMLNKRNHLVIYPQKWNNKKRPEIFPEEWVGIYSSSFNS